ncbi:MAG: tetratricopeptide repeat protein [Acidobacteria bacterium]|nr:MAG: tetratricopeptide repeat protein [Acidobacteriota bacterium]
MSRGLKLAIAAAGVAALIIPLVLITRSSALPWEHDYAAALAQAKARNQMLVAYLYTDWCTYCKKMEAETFPSDQVKSQAGRYVWLKLNPEKDQDGAKLRQLYGVSGYPTIIVLDANGERLEQIEGFMPPETFLQALSGISTQATSVEALKAEIRKQPGSVEVHYNLGQKYLDLKDYREAANAFAQVIQADPDDRHSKNELAYYHLALSVASLQEYSSAHKQLDVLVGKYPDGKLAPQATILRGQIFYQQGEIEKARASFNQFLQKYPGDEKVALVQRMLTEIAPGLPLSASH